MTAPRRLLIILSLLLGLTACERNNYTTWICKNVAGEKSTMIIKKAQMQFQDREFDYCGSLGPNSYFDLKCLLLIQDASKRFTPSTGQLISDGNEYQCNAL